MAWAVGEVLDSLRNNNMAENTLVILMSDHGPHAELCLNEGSTAGLKGGKSNSYEGGFRIPFVAWQPGTVPTGRDSHEVVSSMDIYATFYEKLPCEAADEAKEQLALDGTNIWEELKGDTIKANSLSSKRPIFYYRNTHLMAVRIGRHKVRLTKVQKCPSEHLTSHDPALVFDVVFDPYEAYPLEDEDLLRQVRSKASDVIVAHRTSIDPVPQQLGRFNASVMPCCCASATSSSSDPTRRWQLSDRTRRCDELSTSGTASRRATTPFFAYP